MPTAHSLFVSDVEKLIEGMEYSDELKNRARGLTGNLRNPSPKMVISEFYDVFGKSLKTITEPAKHEELGIAKFYSNDEFIKTISKFVDIRNKAAHSGLDWNSGIDIFAHLKVLIYFCIVNRAGYADKDSACMLSWLFARLF